MEKVTRDQINSLSQKMVTSIPDHDHSTTINLLKEVLDAKYSFSLLDLLGKRIGQSRLMMRKATASLSTKEKLEIEKYV
jgi:hypothetical protein